MKREREICFKQVLIEGGGLGEGGGQSVTRVTSGQVVSHQIESEQGERREGGEAKKEEERVNYIRWIQDL